MSVFIIFLWEVLMTEECFLMVFADMIARLIPTYDLLGWRNPYNLQYVRIFEQKCHVRT